MLRTFRPDVVMTSDPYRRYIWHRDHRIIGQVVLDAVFPFARDRLAYPDLLAEGLIPHKVRELYFWGTEDINFRSDITATFDLKIAALRCHASQVREFNRGTRPSGCANAAGRWRWGVLRAGGGFPSRRGSTLKFSRVSWPPSRSDGIRNARWVEPIRKLKGKV